MKLTRISLAALAVALLGLGSTAEAGSVNCPALGDPVPGGTATRQFTLTIADPLVATCLAYGQNNLSGSADAVNALGYQTIDKSDNTDNYIGGDGELTVNGANWSFTPVGSYDSYVVAFKVGVADNPDWAAFLLPAGVTSGTWSTIPTQGGGFSHALLYGKPCGGTTGNDCDQLDVPEPTSMALLGLGLLGAGFIRRRKS